MPPSPWLSARITNRMYFSEMTMSIAHSTSDSTPSTLSGVTGTWWPWCSPKLSFSAYSGLVPMSPKTTPRAPTVSLAMEELALRSLIGW